MSESGSSGGGPGCLSIILLVIVVWVLLFGVTWNGKHYGIYNCSTERGVEFR